MRAHAQELGHRALAGNKRVRLAGLATLTALLVMGLFAGVAQASSVTSLTVDNTSPSAAAGAKTVYKISFNTTAGPLAGSDQITINFPAGTTLGPNSNSAVTVNGGASVGNCGRNGLVATCTLGSGKTIPANSSVTVELDAVINPSTPSTTEQATVATTDDTDAVPSANYSVIAGHPVSNVLVDNTVPTAAQSATTVYKVSFTTSTTGTLSQVAGSQITINFPAGTTLGPNSNSAVTVNGGASVGNCGRNGLVATCTLGSGKTIPANSSVTVELDVVANPSTPSDTEQVTVSTTSDNPTSTVPSANYSVIAGHPVSNVLVDNTVPTAAQSATTVYKVSFTTSTTGTLSQVAGSQITINFPAGTTLGPNSNSAVTVNGGASVGNCGRNGLVATCTLGSGKTIPANSSVTVELDVVANPSTPSDTEQVTVSTTSDNPTSTVPSANYSVIAGHPVSNATLKLSNVAPGATGVTYLIGFTTSATGALSQVAGSQITINFPAGTTLGPNSNSAVTVNGGASVGNCGRNGLVATCTLGSGKTIPANSSVTVELDNVTNPASPPSPETVMVSTTSDTTPVTSGGGQQGGPPAPVVTSITPSSGPSAGGTSVTINGSNFNSSTVTFGSVPASITSNTGSQMVVTSPPGTGTVDVIVTNAGGSSTTGDADRFTYTSAPPPPPPPPTSPPAVTPSSPSTPSATSAAVSGAVNPHGLATTVVFQYGLDLSQRGPGSSITLYDQSTAPQQVGSGTGNQSLSANLTNLIAGGLYHVRMVATNSAGTTNGPDQTFTTPKAAPPPPPVLGKTQNAAPVSGKTFILINGKFVPLTSATKIPSGATIDALHGTLSLTSATGAGKKTQTGTFGGAVFKVTQARSGLTTLSLVNNAFKGAPSFAACTTKKGKAVTAALSRKVLQLLHAKDNHGKFRSKGRYAAATTRGTVWSIADRCDGTLTSVSSGVVTVNDFVRHVNVTVRAHHSYLALAKPTKHG